nr:PhnD/SsuA/transferrin family substrate-binding protein [Thioalkalivibrio sp. ALE30]
MTRTRTIPARVPAAHWITRPASTVLIPVLLMLGGLPALANDAQTRSLGIQPFLSPPALFERYAPLRDWLSEQLEVPVRIESARTRDVFHQRLAAERYDLVFTSPHVVPFLETETRYQAIAATRDRLAILIAVLPESPFDRVEDLANARIAAPFEESLAAAYLNHALSRQSWTDEESRPIVRHHHHHSAAVTTFLRGETEALVLVTDGDLVESLTRLGATTMLMSLGDGTLVRVIEASPTFPGMTLLARDTVVANAGDLTRSLIRLEDSAQGQHLLRAIRHRGFVAVQDTDFLPFRQDAFKNAFDSFEPKAK